MEENNFSDDQIGRARVQDSPELVAYYKELEALGAVVYLNQLSTENMSEEELNNLVRDVVISITPEPLTYYTQGGNNFIVLSYY